MHVPGRNPDLGHVEFETARRLDPGRMPFSHALGKGESDLSQRALSSNKMSGDEDSTYVFACPVCEESLEVNEAMKDALVERGCVICGAAVSGEAFCACATNPS